MPTPKRTIPVSEVKPGDSIGLGVTFVLFVTRVLPNDHDEYGDTRIYARGPSGRLYAERFDQGSTVTVGYTNRKAKRARGKIARRARFAERDAAIGESVMRASASWCDEADFLQAQSDRLASSISPAEDAAIIRETIIAGRT